MLGVKEVRGFDSEVCSQMNNTAKKHMDSQNEDMLVTFVLFFLLIGTINRKSGSEINRTGPVLCRARIISSLLFR